jgi:hypothetical protein
MYLQVCTRACAGGQAVCSRRPAQPRGYGRVLRAVLLQVGLSGWCVLVLTPVACRARARGTSVDCVSVVVIVVVCEELVCMSWTHRDGPIHYAIQVGQLVRVLCSCGMIQQAVSIAHRAKCRALGCPHTLSLNTLPVHRRCTVCSMNEMRPRLSGICVCRGVHFSACPAWKLTFHEHPWLNEPCQTI